MEIDKDSMFSPNASYRDLVGKAELAWDNERVALNAIAQASGIDTAIYTPLGISTYFSASFFSLSMYVAINEAQANGKKAIVKVSTDLTYNQFQKLLKEFTVNVFLPYEKWEGYEYLGESSVTNL